MIIDLIMKKLSVFFIFFVVSCTMGPKLELVFEDGFDRMQRGAISTDMGADTEYHYLQAARPHGAWAVATFSTGVFPLGWSLREDSIGRYFHHKYSFGSRFWNPIVVAGDSLWQNYRLEARFIPDEAERRSGMVFRYRNNRSYYFWGVEKDTAVLKMVHHGKVFRQLHEVTLAKAPFTGTQGKMLNVFVEMNGDHIKAGIENGPVVEATDATFGKGKVGYLSAGQSRFYGVKVFMTPTNKNHFEQVKHYRADEEKQLQEANPGFIVWKKLDTRGFGCGRNLRFGDLNNDKKMDVLITQIVNHGPLDAFTEVSCLTAMTFDGEKLWQIGEPDLWKVHQTSDVGVQIHDVNNDGKAEVIYGMSQQIWMVDGATGKVLRKQPTPVSPRTGERIHVDCIFFCDLSGAGYDGDMIIKDRYWNVWAYNKDWKILWTGSCTTGHYPYAKDIDGDGRDELLVGTTLFSPDGKVLWTKDKELRDHADGSAIVDFKQNGVLGVLISCSDEGAIFLDTDGRILRHHHIGHAQNPVVANFRDDMPGLETVSINFWYNQGILHFYDSDGHIYHDAEPNHYGSMCLPLNWTGRSEEYFVHNANVDEGGAYDGWGRKVLQFPDDGHPDMCNAVLDITGDCRDEIVVWNPYEIWVYTQSDNPLNTKLYKPIRNALYNYSNYQASVSLPNY